MAEGPHRAQPTKKSGKRRRDVRRCGQAVPRLHATAPCHGRWRVPGNGRVAAMVPTAQPANSHCQHLLMDGEGGRRAAQRRRSQDHDACPAFWREASAAHGSKSRPAKHDTGAVPADLSDPASEVAALARLGASPLRPPHASKSFARLSLPLRRRSLAGACLLRVPEGSLPPARRLCRSAPRGVEAHPAAGSRRRCWPCCGGQPTHARRTICCRLQGRQPAAQPSRTWCCTLSCAWEMIRRCTRVLPWARCRVARMLVLSAGESGVPGGGGAASMSAAQILRARRAADAL